MNKNVSDTISIASGSIGALIGINDLNEWVTLIFTIVCLISTIITIVIRVIERIQKAKADDGKVDLEEAKQILQETNEDLKGVKKNERRKDSE